MYDGIPNAKGLRLSYVLDILKEILLADILIILLKILPILSVILQEYNGATILPFSINTAL